MREFARTLPAQPLDNAAERLELTDQVTRLQRENELLKAELAAAREDRPTAKEYEDVCTTNHSMEQEIAELRALCAEAAVVAACPQVKFHSELIGALAAAGRGEGSC